MTFPPAGAAEWTAARREAYANGQGQPASLVAVTARSNRSGVDPREDVVVGATGLPQQGQGHLGQGGDPVPLAADQCQVKASSQVSGVVCHCGPVVWSVRSLCAMRHWTVSPAGAAVANTAEPTCIALTQASHIGKMAARGSSRQRPLARVSVVVRASPRRVGRSSSPSISSSTRARAEQQTSG